MENYNGLNVFNAALAVSLTIPKFVLLAFGGGQLLSCGSNSPTSMINPALKMTENRSNGQGPTFVSNGARARAPRVYRTGRGPTFVILALTKNCLIHNTFVIVSPCSSYLQSEMLLDTQEV